MKTKNTHSKVSQKLHKESHLIWLLIIGLIVLVLILSSLAWKVFNSTSIPIVNKNIEAISPPALIKIEIVDRNNDSISKPLEKNRGGGVKKETKTVKEKETTHNKKNTTTERYSKAKIAVEEYFVSIGNSNCKKAKKIRPKYKINDCKKVRKVDTDTWDIELITHGRKTAVVFVSILLTKLNTDKNIEFKEERAKGHYLLRKKNGYWLITKYTSISKLTQEQFLNENFLENEHEPDWLSPAEEEPLINFTTNPKENNTWIDREEEIIDADLAVSPIDQHWYNSLGSKNVLSLWSKKELYGNPAKDRKVRRPIPATHIPPQYKTPQKHWTPVPLSHRNSIRYIDTKEKIVALTFDLCEREKETTGYDSAIVNYLRKNNIQATFYAGGKWMRSHPDKTQQIMADPLFEIGNHAWTHGNMRVLKGQEMRDQILWTQAQYEILRDDLQERFDIDDSEMEKIQPIPKTFRFPYGTCSPESLDTLAELGLPAVQWDIVTGDPARGQTGKRISRAILKQVRPGSIIIAHANGRGHGTEDSLPRFIPQLIKRGYKFVTVSELLASSGKVKATKTCYEERPGDNKRYDRIFGKGTQ